MTYRKFKADYLFTGQDLQEGMVLITTDDGTVQGVLPGAEAGEGVEVFSGILSPGFVNCHCHLQLSHMKGLIQERTGLVDFLAGVIKRREAANEDDMAMAEQEMLDNGIVAVGDICNTADTLSLKTEGRLYYHNFIETMGFIEQGAKARFDQGLAVFGAFADAYSLPIAANSIVPHAPYSVSPALFRMIANFPGNHLLTIHNQEVESENEFYLSGKGDFLRLYQQLGLDVSFFQGTGKRSLASYLSHFYRNQSLILVHNVATREEDLVGLRQAAGSPGIEAAPAAGAGGPCLYFCLCPNANLYISGQLPDVDLLIRKGCTIVIGTDSLASNHQLSILEEIKTLQGAFPQLDTGTLLKWATFNGARALELEGVLGSFSPGKQPGVVLLEDLEGERLGARATARRLL